MARLSSKARKALPASDFALGKGHFPINDIEHGRKALELDYDKSPAQRAEISAKVHAKFPSIGGLKAAAAATKK